MEMTAEQRLDHFLELEPDWDSYGALIINPKAIGLARLILAEWPDAFPVPSPGGGVRMEWINNGQELDVGFSPDGSSFEWLYDPDSPNSTDKDWVWGEGLPITDWPKMAVYLRRMYPES